MYVACRTVLLLSEIHFPVNRKYKSRFYIIIIFTYCHLCFMLHVLFVPQVCFFNFPWSSRGFCRNREARRFLQYYIIVCNFCICFLKFLIKDSRFSLVDGVECDQGNYIVCVKNSSLCMIYKTINQDATNLEPQDCTLLIVSNPTRQK